MTIPNTARKAGPLLGTGSQTAWPFTFKVFAAGDVQVTIANSAGTETLLVLGTDYSVTLNSNQETSPGGTVNYPISGAALPVGSVLAIIGDLDYDQPLDLPSGGNFSPLALENQLDRATMQIQQLKEEVDRSAKLPATSLEDAEALVDDLQRIADSADNLDTVAGNIAAVNVVASDLNEPVSEINTVAASIANVNAVGSNISNVNTVAGISANVTTVAGIAANVTAVAAIDDDVTAVAGVSAAVTAVAAIDDDVTIAAANVADITNFADVYQGPKASDPALRNNGSALQVGDLYFNTAEQALRTYGGTQWVAGTAGTMAVQNFSGNGSTTAFTLAVAPASENNTQVYIGGVYQQKDQYSVSDTTLTFSTAPTTGTNNIEVVTISTLALGETDAALVAFVQAGTGAVERTAQAKLRESVSVKDFGAVGGPAADDTAAVANVSKQLPTEYPATAYSNPRGADITPGGFVHNRTTGRVYNPTAQREEMAFGQECLQAWFSKFDGASNKNNGDATIRAIVISGDSTTFGVGATKATPAALLEDLAEARGYTNVGVVNRGQSGKATFDWVSTYLSGDLAAFPDLLVLRWGANDPFFGRTEDQFISDLRTGLATIRASRNVASLSVLLMTPNTMNDVPNGRSEAWMERINAGIRQAALDYQCAFIDTYGIFQNSHDGADVWMDAISYGGINRGIHPKDVFYEHIAGVIGEMIFPQWGRDWRCNAVRNTSGGDTAAKRTNADLPSAFLAGIGMHRMADGTGTNKGGPYDGVAYTFKQADGVALQFSVPILGSSRGNGISARLGWASAWGIWYGEEKDGTSLLVNGWTNLSGYKPLTYQTTLEGRAVLNGTLSAGTTTNNTIIATLPAGYRPAVKELFNVATENGTALIQVDTDGTVKIFRWGTGGAYICLSGVSFKLAP